MKDCLNTYLFHAKTVERREHEKIEYPTSFLTLYTWHLCQLFVCIIKEVVLSFIFCHSEGDTGREVKALSSTEVRPKNEEGLVKGALFKCLLW